MKEGTQTQQGLPPAQRHIIKRPRLTKLLDETEARIILLIAPAGYGKTTLAREWLTQRGRQTLFYRIRETIDPTVVAEGLAAAIAPIAANARPSLREFLTATTTPDRDPELLADVLMQDFGTWLDRTWLFIDDYQAIAGVESCERVIAHFISRLNPRVLLTSRDRPRWMTSRSLLYGEAIEFRRDTLALTESEASQILGGKLGDHHTLLALAQGWPAVIGLAALLPYELPTANNVPSALYDYLAEELYDRLSDATKNGLVLLSIPTALDRSTVLSVLGPSSPEVIREAAHVGFIAMREDDFEIHPLVRAFLRRKLIETPIKEEACRNLIRYLMQGERWDDAFALISDFALSDELPHLIGRGAPQLLATGRLATVERWIKWGEERGVEAPEISLARAEVHFRRGDWQLAKSLATSSARLAPTSEFAARCYICAGNAAHLLDDNAQAAQFFARALSLHGSSETKRQALWGRFVAAFLQDQRSGYVAYRDMEHADDSTPAHLVRLTQARLLISSRAGGVAESIANALSTEPLLEHVADPLIRSGFLNNLADSLVIAGFYDEAERVVERELAEAKRFRLGFVMPNALFNLASVKLGLGSYTSAVALVDRACAESQTDPFLTANAHGIRMRIALSSQDRYAIEHLLQGFDSGGQRPDIAGEVLASFALAEAIHGNDERARHHIEDAKRLALFATTKTLVAAAESILTLRAVSDPGDTVDQFSSVVAEMGAIDSALVALRASRELLDACAQHSRARAVVEVAAKRSRDSTLATAAGVSLDRTRSGSAILSAREREVLELVAQGLRNNEIAQRLFISPKTVKAHLQHIYDKLEVRSRTAAATRARDAGLLG